MIDKAARLGWGHVAVQHPEYLDTPTLTRTVRRPSQKHAIAEADPASTAVERTIRPGDGADARPRAPA